MITAALVVAAGRGERLGGPLPKQYLRLGPRTILVRSLEAMLAHSGIDVVQVVIHPEDAALCAEALAGLEGPRLRPRVSGGATRRDSVLAGLRALEPLRPDRVLIHDAARPFVTPETTETVIRALETAQAAFPVLAVPDALWRAAEGVVQAEVARQGLWRAQTPQGFAFPEILAAHLAHSGEALDDIAVAHAAGLRVAMVPGDEGNFKITTAQDLVRARRQAGDGMDVRTGNGFDVHAFGEGTGVTLCGVALPFARGLVGHSDADVGMHAVTDAIFGALGEGDIGQWFPPSDPAWKGAASQIFLEKAVSRVAERGFVLTHLDCTLVCEAPRIGPHAAAMRACLAEIAGIEPERVSVKATTAERLGFTGRGEGIAALATATLVRP